MGAVEASMINKRWGFVVLAFIQAGLTSGIIFGWPELEHIFIQNGVYRDHCANEPTPTPSPGPITPCPAQSNFFNSIFTAGVFANNAAPLITGIFVDKFGPKLTSLASVFLFAIGCGLFVIPSPNVYLPAFMLLGFSGPGIYVSIMHLNNLFPGHQAKVLNFFSGTFTVSNFVFKVFRILNEDNGWFTIPRLFIILVVVLVPFFLLGAIIWPNKPYQLPTVADDDFAQRMPLVEKGETKILYNGNLKTQIVAPELWLIIAWMAITNLHIAFFVGSAADQFPQTVGIFNWIWEFGWVAIPAFGIMLDKMGIVFSIFVSNIALFLWSIIGITPVPALQYAGFVLVSTVNVGVWGIFYTFLSKTFGFNNYGKLLGTACITIAVVGLLQHPIYSYTQNKLQKDYLPANILFCVLTFLVFITPFILWRREKAALQKKHDPSSYNIQTAY
jgi:MFS family permease